MFKKVFFTILAIALIGFLFSFIFWQDEITNKISEYKDYIVERTTEVNDKDATESKNTTEVNDKDTTETNKTTEINGEEGEIEPVAQDKSFNENDEQE